MMEFDRDATIAEQQMEAIIFLLVAFGYIDESFDPAEKAFISDHIRKLVAQRASRLSEPPGIDILERWTQHFLEVLDRFDNSVQSYFTESVGDGETTQQFVVAKLKLHCLELLKRFDEQNQRALLGAVETLMHADGVVHPAEEAFRDDLIRLVAAPDELAFVDEPTEADDQDDDRFSDTLSDPESAGGGRASIVIDGAQEMKARTSHHPFFDDSEWDYTLTSEAFAEECKSDLALLDSATSTLSELRQRGNGRLSMARDFRGFTRGAPFLDGHVYVIPPEPSTTYELTVVGDLHGCYSCLKAALLQSDFLAKVQAHRESPGSGPVPYLVLLGDYIDRGKFSYSGTLRTVLQLLVRMPDHVFVLRGNHEFYVEINGRILAPVRPCEAMDAIAEVADNRIFARYMRLFETLPNSLVFGSTYFVHGGIPRADTFKEKWKGVSSLNDAEMRFQMMWSDPSETDFVPLELQQASARFPFGRKQFHEFMRAIGCQTMVRGHERVIDGFRAIYDDDEGTLLSLFSAGGADNDDLPARSNYREVTPMALTITQSDDITTFTPFQLDYKRFNNPEYNGFFRASRLPSAPAE